MSDNSLAVRTDDLRILTYVGLSFNEKIREFAVIGLSPVAPSVLRAVEELGVGRAADDRYNRVVVAVAKGDCGDSPIIQLAEEGSFDNRGNFEITDMDLGIGASRIDVRGLGRYAGRYVSNIICDNSDWKYWKEDIDRDSIRLFNPSVDRWDDSWKRNW